VQLTIAAPLRIEAHALRGGCTSAHVERTGMGRRHAVASGRRLAAALTGNDPGCFAVGGVAGGVTTELAPGSVVVANEVRTIDGRVAPLPLPAAPVVAAALRAAGVPVAVGPVVSSPHLLRPSERPDLVASGALAVDMESAWLLDPVQHAGIDPRTLAVVRVLVDTPRHELFSPATVGNGRRALATLRSTAAALERWAGAFQPRRIVLPVPRSFCAGVERAIEIVERSLERYGRPVYVRRQIVHNTHVVRELEAAGAVFVEELDDVPDGATVVFAAHGVTPEVRTDAGDRGLFVIDATCPLVAKVHHEARLHRDQGTRIVLIGHAEHEEVVGTLGEAPDAVVVSRVDDVSKLAFTADERVAYLTQTTLAVDETAEVVAALHERFPDIVAPASDDICYATQHRQEAVRAIAEACDVVLVVGSANSSNSNRLVEVARRTGRPAHLLEDENDLDLAWLDGVDTIGLTAGASAPDELVHRVVAALELLGPVTVEERCTVEETVRFRLPKEVR
jgi:4-hydroxy-3-methylbut-2-enyl diphosphate reductase